MINRMVDQQAFTLAVDDLFFLSGMLFLLLLVLVWATKPAKSAGVGTIPVQAVRAKRLGSRGPAECRRLTWP